MANSHSTLHFGNPKVFLLFWYAEIVYFKNPLGAICGRLRILHKLTKSKMAAGYYYQFIFFVTICDKATYNISFSCMKYLLNRLLALIMQLKIKVTSKVQAQLVWKGKVTKKAVCLSNSIQHLVTGCSNIGLCYQIYHLIGFKEMLQELYSCGYI